MKNLPYDEQIISEINKNTEERKNILRNIYENVTSCYIEDLELDKSESCIQGDFIYKYTINKKYEVTVVYYSYNKILHCYISGYHPDINEFLPDYRSAFGDDKMKEFAHELLCTYYDEMDKAKKEK